MEADSLLREICKIGSVKDYVAAAAWPFSCCFSASVVADISCIFTFDKMSRTYGFWST